MSDEAAVGAHEVEQHETWIGPDPLIYTTSPARSPKIPGPPGRRAPELLEMTIDGVPVMVPKGSSILAACRAQGIDIPTLCHGETVEPEGVCRLCVVDSGGKVLTPSCSAKVSQGMNVNTENERVRHSRKLVLELLASSVDVDLAGPALPDQTIAAYMARYGADPERFGPRGGAAAANERDERHAGHHHITDGSTAETVAQPVKIDNDLYIRDYSKCILCYKCVEACGVDAQNSFAISVAGENIATALRLKPESLAFAMKLSNALGAFDWRGDRLDRTIEKLQSRCDMKRGENVR
ncbi:MAG: 2Fe-2S iron-sulfur cluster-binding protein [Verrucomicrobia bacterium]|nr:2Fe-2S iron-sulfur cluster-binding protein [Verrucomicrobiota bacterium]